MWDLADFITAVAGNNMQADFDLVFNEQFVKQFIKWYLQALRKLENDGRTITDDDIHEVYVYTCQHFLVS